MDLSNKTTKIGIALLALLLIAGLTLFYSGSDAVAVALEKKEGILTCAIANRKLEAIINEVTVTSRGK